MTLYRKPLWPLFLFVLALVVTPAVTQAQDHLIVIELELNDAGAPGSCPIDSPVVISAADCDGGGVGGGDDIAAKLQQGLIDAGLVGSGISTFCLFAAGPGDYECVWTVPAGCTQDRERYTIERGCGGNASITATIFEPMSFGSGYLGFFFFEMP